MKLGVNTWVWVSPLTTAAVSELVPKIKQIGSDWIEYPIEAPDGFDYEVAGKLARDHALGVSVAAAISPDRDLLSPDRATQQAGIDYLVHCIEAAAKMGSHILMGPMYSATGRTWQMSADERKEQVDLLVDHWRKLAPIAAAHGVTCCLEPLNRFETSFLNTVAQAVAIIDQIDHPNCLMMVDTFHMNIEEKSLGDAIRLGGKRIKHVHACENDRGTPGTGNVTWPDVANGLRDIGYDGAVVIESFTSQVKSIARAAAIWRPLAPSQDELASGGLQFLRKLFP